MMAGVCVCVCVLLDCCHIWVFFTSTCETQEVQTVFYTCLRVRTYVRGKTRAALQPRSGRIYTCLWDRLAPARLGSARLPVAVATLSEVIAGGRSHRGVICSLSWFGLSRKRGCSITGLHQPVGLTTAVYVMTV